MKKELQRKFIYNFICDEFMGVGSYTKAVTASHRRFQAAQKRARTRQAVLNAYWKHKKEHERMLAKHLKEEFSETNRRKNKIPPR